MSMKDLGDVLAQPASVIQYWCVRQPVVGMSNGSVCAACPSTGACSWQHVYGTRGNGLYVPAIQYWCVRQHVYGTNVEMVCVRCPSHPGGEACLTLVGAGEQTPCLRIRYTLDDHLCVCRLDHHHSSYAHDLHTAAVVALRREVRGALKAQRQQRQRVPEAAGGADTLL